MSIKKKWVSWEEFQNVLQGGAWTPSPHTHEKGDITDWLHATSHEKGGDDLIDTLGDLTVDKLILGSYYLDSNALVANNLVFNSSKWNGQTIYLTGVTGGQILKYNSSTFRWENYDVPPPPAHATSHEKGGSDLIDTLGDLTVDSFIIGSYYLDSNGLVGNNLVFNSQKWSGQTHYLTDVQGGDILRYDSSDFRWENAAHDKALHNALALTELGTIDTGVWQGTAIGWTYVSKTGSNLTDLATRLHSSLQSIGADDHHDQLHASTHESGQSDQIDLVFNSQKWSGQTIYLTGVTNGQILRYDSGDLRWENADLADHNHTRSQVTDFFGSPFWASIPDKPSTFPPSSHKSSHEKGGGDLISTLGDLTIDKFTIGSYYLDTNGLVANNQVFNSQKWDGQAIYLTDVQPGDILKYNSVTFRWENYDFVADAHASTHLVGGDDPLSVGVPVNIGTSNAAGTATNFARRDHVHAHPSGLGVDLHHAQSHSLASHSTKAHSELTGIGVNDHHDQSHTLASHSTKAHSELTGIGAGDHHAQLHAATHKSGQSDEIDLVFNSQKWNGQTIYLTGVTGGQILKYDSVDFRWENYDFAHASEHEVGGNDLISHDDLTDFVAAEHLSLPNTIANVLSNHNVAVHNALDITELGTVSSGVWQGTAIAWTYVSKTGSNLTDLATRQHAGLTDVTESQHHTKTGHDEVYGLMRQGIAAGKGDPTPTAKIYYETDTGILKQVEDAAWVERLRAEASTRLAQLSEKAHASLTGVTSDLHHPQSHTLASHSTKAHSELTGVGVDDHHDQLHATAHEKGGGT